MLEEAPAKLNLTHLQAAGVVEAAMKNAGESLPLVMPAESIRGFC